MSLVVGVSAVVMLRACGGIFAYVALRGVLLPRVPTRLTPAFRLVKYCVVNEGESGRQVGTTWQEFPKDCRPDETIMPYVFEVSLTRNGGWYIR